VASLLLVDSDRALMARVCAHLVEVGHGVRHAVDGESGLRRYREMPADLVVGDVVAGRGVAAMVHTLRDEAPEARFLLTGDGPYLAQMAGTFGVCWTLEKPFTPEELARVAAELLG